MANSPSTIPTTQDDANSATGMRAVVIIGGLVSAFFLLPTVPWAWVIIGAILVPWVWIVTGHNRKAMMSASGCESKEEWNAFVNKLPTKKELKKQSSHLAAVPGTALAAIHHAEQRPVSAKPSRQSSKQPGQPRMYIPGPRSELQYPEYKVLAGTYANYEVVGEAFREQSVISALGGLTPETEKTLENVITHLIPEPENPFGKGHAVMVWMNGHHVGYLSNEDASRYFGPLNRIVRAGYLPTTTGRLWGVSRRNYDGELRHHLYARFAIHEPDQLFPSNDPPEGGYSLLPWGPAIQVTKESEHLAELTKHLHGPESYAIATLRSATRTLKSGAVREYITVHLDAEKIGELSAVSSEKILPVVKHLNGLGYETAAWSRVKGTPLAVEVSLYVLKAHEIPPEWFSSIPVTVPSLSH